MTIVLFLIILGALIFVHELGHFISAKKAGIRVDEFALGFPPKLWSKKVGETLYSLNLIPFGGYVKIYGEDGDDSSSPPFQGGDRGVVEFPLPKGGAHSDVPGVVTTLPADLPAEADSAQAGDGGAPSTKGDSRRFISRPRSIQALVLASGVLGNIVFAWLLISATFLAGVPSSIEGRYIADMKNPMLTITSVLPDAPAGKVGLKAGDAILAMQNGSRSFEGTDADEARAFIGESAGDIALRYKRGNEVRTAVLAPIEGIVEGKPALGITLDTVGIVRFGIFRSLYEGLLMTWDLLREVTVGLLEFLKQAFLGEADLAAITGPIGIAGLVGEARVFGFVYLLSFTAFISINLAVINLLPIPALDGGRLLFLAVEAIVRRPIPAKFTRLVNSTGFVLLLLFMVFITYRDIMKLL